MLRSQISLLLRWLALVLPVAGMTVLVAPAALADGFNSSFSFGSINVSDASPGGCPTCFLVGPFDYGFSPVGVNSTVVGQVSISSISVSADATLISTNPNFGNISAFNWAVFVGPTSFGLTPGQVNGTTAPPDVISKTNSAPTQFQFAQSAGTVVGGTMYLTGSNDYTTTTFQSSPAGTFFPTLNFTAPGEFENGLYAQVFMWTEAGDSIDFNNIKVTVDGTVTQTPEPSSMLLLGAGAVPLIGLLRRKSTRRA